jgi:hypothetical protein
MFLDNLGELDKLPNNDKFLKLYLISQKKKKRSYEYELNSDEKFKNSIKVAKLAIS